MNVRNKRVFLSGPMTGLPDLNVGEFAIAHHRLKVAGAECIYDPAMNYLLRERTKRMTHDNWMRVCLHELTQPDQWNEGNHYHVMVSLDGWHHSEGATLERAVAEAIGMEVCELDDVEVEQ